MPKPNDPMRKPKVKVTWIEKVPRRRSSTREELQAKAEAIAKNPGKWALIAAYAPTDAGYKAADQRATNYRRSSSAFSKVGKFQWAVRYDPGFTGDYKNKKRGQKGAWILITRCHSVHKREFHDYEDPMAFKYTLNAEEATDGEDPKPEG